MCVSRNNSLAQVAQVANVSWDTCRKNSYLRFANRSTLWILTEQLHPRYCGVPSPNPSPLSCIVNQTQFNWISIDLIQTQLNWIHGFSSTKFGKQMKLNSYKNNWTIKLNSTFHYRFFAKLGLKNINNKSFVAWITLIYFVLRSHNKIFIYWSKFIH